MAFAIPRNTANAVERTIPFVLVDATDFTTPEDINVAGVKAQLSFGGAADVNSTNDITKVDGALGMYAIVLTQAEANNAAGTVHGHCRPTGCARTYFEAQIGPSNLNSAMVDANVVQIDGATGPANIIRNSILNWEPFTGYSLARLLRVIGIVLRGTASGLGTTSATFTAPAGGATVTATVDASGNRTVVADTASGTP